MGTTTPAEDEPAYERTPEQIRYDATADQIRETAQVAREVADMVRELVSNGAHGNVQTVIHKTQGMGVVGVICATICVMCIVVLILGAIIFVPDIHDLNAWVGVFGRDIEHVKADIKHLQQEKPK